MAQVIEATADGTGFAEVGILHFEEFISKRTDVLEDNIIVV